MSSGVEFEDLAEEVFRVLTRAQASRGELSIERDVRLVGADGPRQIDIVIRLSAGPIELLIIVECKDHKTKIDIPKIDALHSVLQDVRASKAIMVSRRGFSGGARRKAARLGIDLFMANQLGNLRESIVEVPIYVREIRPTSVDVRGPVYLEAGTTITRESLWNINDLDLRIVIRDELLANPNLMLLDSGQHILPLTRISPPWFIRDAEGRKWTLTDLEISYELEERHFFGYIADLDKAILLKNELLEESRVLIKAEDFVVGYEASFVRFDSREAIPVDPVIIADVAAFPAAESLSPGTFTLTAMD